MNFKKINFDLIAMLELAGIGYEILQLPAPVTNEQARPIILGGTFLVAGTIALDHFCNKHNEKNKKII